MSYKKVLSEEELKTLSKIKTSKEEAEVILKRNLACLEALRELKRKHDEKDYTIGVSFFQRDIPYGCPHCLYDADGEEIDTNCNACAYAEVAQPGRDSSYCSYVPFAGVSLSKVLGSFYCSRKYSVNLYACNVIIRCRPSIEDEGSYVDCENFLLGHIEWASRILEGSLSYA